LAHRDGPFVTTFESSPRPKRTNARAGDLLVDGRRLMCVSQRTYGIVEHDQGLRHRAVRARWHQPP
jgi:hypothetical protein